MAAAIVDLLLNDAPAPPPDPVSIQQQFAASNYACENIRLLAVDKVSKLYDVSVLDTICERIFCRAGEVLTK